MVEVAGVEPEYQIVRDKDFQRLRENSKTQFTHIDSQSLGIVCPELARIIDKWDLLSPTLKRAIVAIVNSTDEREVKKG